MIKCIITDIEGTTTAIDFVIKVLFKYAHDHLAEFVEHQAGDDIVEECISEAKQTIIEEDHQNNDDHEKDRLPPTRENAVDKLLFWIETDRKHPALKKLQGYIWERGYHEGKINGHIYEDVPQVLAKWQKEGIKLGVYSSGSVKAQKHLLGFSDFGDLAKYFDYYFDRATGHKNEVDSYKHIQQQVGVKPQEILFLSDMEDELDAAKEAGLQTMQLVRPETMPSGKHPKVNDFPEVYEKLKELN